ncbi:MAG TPA: trigger factor [Holophagaceae bacterium]|jgi:trigger factor|nr:trigger factor [Holophagaceae bacterium]
MTATLTQHSPTRMSLEFSVPAKEVTDTFEAVVSSFAPKARIPGFRPGKAPKTVLIQKFSREVHQDVAERLVRGHFWNEAEQAGVQPISNPALEKMDLKDGSDATMRLLFDVAPQVTLPDYKKLELTKRKRKISAADVDEQLEGLRQRATKLLPVDAPAAAGLLATCDIKAKLQGRKPETYRDQVIELDPKRPFDAAIIGAKADETRSFDVEHGEDAPAMAGRQVHYTVNITDVRRREVPEIGDELAKDLGETDLAALKAKVKSDLEEAAERDAESRVHANILDMLLDASPFEVPRSLVIMQLDDYCNEFAREASQQGIDPKRVNWNAYRQHRLNDAERAVRSGYLLQAVGNAEDIQVADDEIDADIRSFMDENKIQTPFDAFKADLEKRGATTEVKGRLRTDKIFKHLMQFTAIKEELLDKEAFLALVELERKREAGEPVSRFDAGGLEGGALEGQEGGDPAAVMPAEHVHGPDCDHDHEPKVKKTAKKTAPKAEKAEVEAEAKPKKTVAKKKAE